MSFYDTVRLRDGRLLEYGEAGSSSGTPILLFHGTPSSGWIDPATERTVAAEGARLISVYRPGYGRSTRRASFSLTSWPSDIGQLADALAIERFSVCALSGGAAYALVCAWGLSDRVVRVGLISGLGPPELAHLASPGTRTAWWYAQRAPLLLWARWTGRGAWKVMGEWIRSRGQARSYRDTFRRGPWGPYSDVRLSARPWGFDLGEIRSPVAFWHGSLDSKVPIEMARALAASIPGAEMFLCDGLEHDLSAPVRRAAIHWTITGECVAA